MSFLFCLVFFFNFRHPFIFSIFFPFLSFLPLPHRLFFFFFFFFLFFRSFHFFCFLLHPNFYISPHTKFILPPQPSISHKSVNEFSQTISIHIWHDSTFCRSLTIDPSTLRHTQHGVSGDESGSKEDNEVNCPCHQKHPSYDRTEERGLDPTGHDNTWPDRIFSKG